MRGRSRALAGRYEWRGLEEHTAFPRIRWFSSGLFLLFDGPHPAAAAWRQILRGVDTCLPSWSSDGRQERRKGIRVRAQVGAD